MKELDDSNLLAGFRIHESDRTSAPGSARESRRESDLESRRADSTALDLERLADQLSAIAEELRHGRSANSAFAGSNLVELTSDHRFGFQEAPATCASNAETARQVYANRRRRTALFGNGELFGEPAWDILLDLYIAHAENKPVSVSSACIGSASPPTTGLRWLGVLAENELILREHDPEDQRRVLVRLTDRGIAAMEEYFGKTVS